ncbi:phage baseplate assembly protein V [Rubricella aquisinus]|uniref:Phage baseplate assembly protein V n=1 Tax=Rubricella aquisinus TaxID=2028108 RepID=A0A840WL35_9RHOB|nr:phage baseplate assembly protein V [Rubricella aquisinus]MBB5515769.1 phage baseplate assembly protein V [Rubricella aquisinus]
MSMSLEQIIDALQYRIAELERRAAASIRIGVVREVDASRGLARVKLSGGAAAFLTGPIPWVEQSAGANRTHIPLSVGQQVVIVSETGDLHDAVIIGSLNSAANARPSQAPDAYVIASVGPASVTVKDGGNEMEFRVGTTSLTLRGDHAHLVADRIDLN